MAEKTAGNHATAIALEPVIDPEITIIDAHHHLWDVWSYGAPELLDDIASGHNVVATVHVEVRRTDYFTDGPPHLKPVGETVAIAALADAVDAAAPHVAAGIVGAGDLAAAAVNVNEMLDAHMQASGRFRGIRTEAFTTWTDKGEIYRHPEWVNTIESSQYLAGARCLASKGLALDLVCTYDQLEGLARFASRVPDLVIVVDHLAPPGGDSAARGSLDTLLPAWRRGIDAIAKQENVYMKLGGCLNPHVGAFLPGIDKI